VRLAQVELLTVSGAERERVAVEDLVVVAEFRDYIYPGLISTGKVQRGGDKPFHTVINGENFHALEALTFTHRGKIDAIIHRTIPARKIGNITTIMSKGMISIGTPSGSL
jgi:adenine-specific DNA-methyltransferase